MGLAEAMENYRHNALFDRWVAEGPRSRPREVLPRCPAPRLADDILEGAPAAAKWTGFKLRSVYHMVRANQIPYFKLGSKLLFRKSELSRRFSAEPSPSASPAAGDFR